MKVKENIEFFLKTNTGVLYLPSSFGWKGGVSLRLFVSSLKSWFEVELFDRVVHVLVDGTAIIFAEWDLEGDWLSIL